MLFHELSLTGSYLIEIEPSIDERGFFARSFCQNEFEKHNLNSHFLQCSISYNHTRGILRGMHFQQAPYEEIKLVRCTRGSIFDVIVDIRSDSPTFKQWYGIVLNAENRKSLYIPGGFAHGFQTLENETEVFYQISEFYHPEASCGIRWNDPAIGIQWPIENPILSAKDQNYRNFDY